MLTAPGTTEALEHARSCVDALRDELLHWTAETGRAEEAGAATETQVQAIQSAVDLARIEADRLRAVLAANADVSDAEAEAIIKMDAELAAVAQEYAALSERAARLFQPKELAEPPLPTSFDPR